MMYMAWLPNTCPEGKAARATRALLMAVGRGDAGAASSAARASREARAPAAEMAAARARLLASADEARASIQQSRFSKSGDREKAYDRATWPVGAQDFRWSKFQ